MELEIDCCVGQWKVGTTVTWLVGGIVIHFPHPQLMAKEFPICLLLLMQYLWQNFLIILPNSPKPEGEMGSSNCR